MSDLFEPLRATVAKHILDETRDQRVSELEEYTKTAVEEEQKLSNRSNPANRLRLSSGINDILNRTFEVWLSDSEDEEGEGGEDGTNSSNRSQESNIGENEHKNRSRIVDEEQEHSNDMARWPNEWKFRNLSSPAANTLQNVTSGYEFPPTIFTLDNDYFSGFYSERRPTRKDNPEFRSIGPLVYDFLTMNTLLHTCVLRQDWDSAYHILQLLIRNSECDIRQIWSIALKILEAKCKQEFQEMVDVTGLSAEQVYLLSISRNATLARTFIRSESPELLKAVLKVVNMSNIQRPFRSKLHRFVRFLVRTYRIPPMRPAPLKYPHQIYWDRSKVDEEPHRMRSTAYIPYREGTMNAVPLYSYSFFWLFMLSGQFKEFKEVAENFSLRPPYNVDPGLKYLQRMNSYLECIYAYFKLRQKMGYEASIRDNQEGIISVWNQQAVRNYIDREINKIKGDIHKKKDTQEAQSIMSGMILLKKCVIKLQDVDMDSDSQSEDDFEDAFSSTSDMDQ